MPTMPKNVRTNQEPLQADEKQPGDSGPSKIGVEQTRATILSKASKDPRPVSTIIMEKATHGAFPVNFAVLPDSRQTFGWLSVKWYESPRLAAIEFSDDSIVYVVNESQLQNQPPKSRATAIGNANGADNADEEAERLADELDTELSKINNGSQNGEGRRIPSDQGLGDQEPAS